MSDIFHVYNRSISGITVFSNNPEYLRFIEEIAYYKNAAPKNKFSYAKKSSKTKADCSNLSGPLNVCDRLVDIIAYCIMPNHYHLVLNQVKDRGIAIFMNNLLNSYTRYFNIKYDRKGTIWEGKYKRVGVNDDDQLLHLTRYVHLNPVTAYYSDKPEEWQASSYREYISETGCDKGICDFKEIIDMDPIQYKIFVEENIAYQRDLAKLKNSTAAVEI